MLIILLNIVAGWELVRERIGTGWRFISCFLGLFYDVLFLIILFKLARNL
jgi:hypothetical protein